MKKQLTEFEILREAGKTYSGFLDIPKAVDFLKFEKGWDIEIIEDEYPNINTDACEKYDVTPKQMYFMKDLQESGEVNMMACRDIIQTRLLLDPTEAKHVHMTYISNYTEIYHSYDLI